MLENQVNRMVELHYDGREMFDSDVATKIVEAVNDFADAEILTPSDILSSKNI